MKPENPSSEPLKPLPPIPERIRTLFGADLVEQILLLNHFLEPYELTYRAAGPSSSDLLAALLEAGLLNQEDFLSELGAKIRTAQKAAEERARIGHNTLTQRNKACRRVRSEIQAAFEWFNQRRLLTVFLREAGRMVFADELLMDLAEARKSGELKAKNNGFGAELYVIEGRDLIATTVREEFFSWAILARAWELSEEEPSEEEQRVYKERADLAFLELSEEGEPFYQTGTAYFYNFPEGSLLYATLKRFDSRARQSLNPFELWSLEIVPKLAEGVLRVGISKHEGQLLIGQSAMFSMVEAIFKAYGLPYVYDILRAQIYNFLNLLKENGILKSTVTVVPDSREEVRQETEQVLAPEILKEPPSEPVAETTVSAELVDRVQIQGRVQVDRPKALSILGDLGVRIERESPHTILAYDNSAQDTMTYPLPGEHGQGKSAENVWRYVVRAFRIFEPVNLAARASLRAKFLTALRR